MNQTSVTSHQLTFFAEEDGSKTLLVFLGGLFACVIFAGIYMDYRRGVLSNALVPVVGLIVLYMAMWLRRYIRQSFVMVLSPEEITWRNCFGETSLNLRNIDYCTMNTPRARFGTSLTSLRFYLKNGSRKKTPCSVYPRLLTEFQKRYSFPIKKERGF